MKPLVRVTGIVAPFNQSNIDTDAILPKQFLKSIRRTGFGPYLFDGLRYLDHGEPGQDCALRPRNSGFVLNQPRYRGASILLARDNFGCGSSREHAPWALEDFGFRVLIAPSFADIFYNNCFKNGLLPITLRTTEIDALFAETEAHDGYSLKIDLESQSVETPAGDWISFDIDPHKKQSLLEGLDDVTLVLRHGSEISQYEARRKVLEPWLFQNA
ncbi:MAG: 3-isopropylmalate dehydratase small subunit [Rhodoferax sp.]|jgi:3-isopropylmalate/(R)-2-methylmalate dehydratase small subunit|uniref:3-isopropylmalate dehydratase small subunit n=1 Tax=Rhodoferax sp. TaxID=50421 RepID=UPI001B56B035|nr:3-isopropylmalate dehydratase small subunit [Rhodoferax sp.]MBP8286091.1 3-isopropylmalate dehydratase small subunit [Rhodoferax sp.]MBP9149831.1 3-isopropylmalate dehydratase small subunit [Rhodoferax sp.]MBP9737012.1 3-isopropylmalate dehydratase small subunit [Rhodoferax sp.]